MAFSPQEAAQVRQAIEALNAEFAWLIDHRNGAGVSERLTQKRIGMIREGNAYLIKAGIVHDTIMAARGGGL